MHDSYCSCAPAISSSACTSHAANSRFKVHPPSSTNITSSSLMTSLLHQASSRDQRALRAHRNPSNSLNPNHRQSPIRRIEQHLPKPSHDAHPHRSPLTSLNHLQNERRQLSHRTALHLKLAPSPTPTHATIKVKALFTLGDNQTAPPKKLLQSSKSAQS